MGDIETILKQFSVWTQWTALKTNDLCNPGVYLLAIKPPQGTPTFSSETKFVYIGETCKQTLYKRLGDFYRSANPSNIVETYGHSGGRVAWRKRVKLRISSKSDLFFSFLSIGGGTEERTAHIRYLERALLWEHTKQHKRGELPPCNSK